MSVRRKMIAVPAMCLMMASAAACGSDDDSGSEEFDCDLGNELSATFAGFNESANGPSVEELEAVRDRLNDFSGPDEISDDIQAVKDGVDVFIEELGSDEIDIEALTAAGESLATGGQNIDAYLAENCG